jgi:predicted dehydrogenase
MARLAGAAPKTSDKLTVACIGVGSQGLRLMMDLLRMPEVQIVAVCDVSRQTSDYFDWGRNELREKVRVLSQDPGWGGSLPGPTAGRDVAKSIVNTFYAKNTGKSTYIGCNSYEDFREVLSKEKDLDAVVISAPDHWHAIIAIRTQELLEWNTTDFRLTRGSARASALLMPQYLAPWSA